MPINRYTDLSVSAYNPMSMEELAVAPMMKRKQHDELDKQLAEAVVKVDPLKYHEEEALRLKNELEGKVASQAEQLASQGITPDAKSSFYKLNKEYRDLTAPTGQVGKINRAKEIYDKEHTAFIKNAMDQSKIGSGRAEELWNEHVAKNYTGYEDPEQKRIKYIDPLGTVAYEDYDKDIAATKSLLGDYSESLGRSGYNIITDPTTQKLMLVNSKGQEIEKSNIRQVDEGLKAFNAKWSNEQGQGRKYANFAGWNATNLNERTKHLFEAMKSRTHGEDMDSTYSFVPGQDGSGDAEKTSGTIISNDSTIKSNAENHETYTDADSKIKVLENSPSLTPAEKSELDDLKDLRKDADDKLKLNPEYTKLQSKFLQKQNEIEKYQSEYFTNKDGILRRKDNASGKFVEIKLTKLKNELDNISNEQSKIKDKAWQKSSSLRHNYSYLPDTPKAEGAWNLHNENVHGVLKGIPNLSSVLDLTGIETTGGLRKDVDDDDVANIQELIKNSDGKSFKISNIKTYGDKKAPEITATFTTNKNASEYDAKGIAWNDEYGGAERPVTVTFKLKRFTNAPDTKSAPGFKNLTGAIAQFYKDKGGINGITGNFQGHEVYNSLITNAYSDLTNEQLAERYSADSDAQEVLNDRAIKRGLQPSQLVTKYAKYKN
jgi:hypothetical protein